MEYRDEWTRCPFDFVESGILDRLLERHLLEKADLVIYTTESHKVSQLEHFKNHTSKIVVIPNGWEKDDFSITEKNKFNQDNKIILSFVGQMATHSFPREFLNMIENILSRNSDLKGRLLIRFIGRKPESALQLLSKFKYQNNLEIVDLVSKKEAIAYMKSSDALVIFSMPELASYRPGKIYDYLASHRPVLNMGSKGECSDLIESLNFGWHVGYNEEQKLNQILSDIGCSTFKLDDSTLSEWLESHTRENLVERTIKEIFNNN